MGHAIGVAVAVFVCGKYEAISLTTLSLSPMTLSISFSIFSNSGTFPILLFLLNLLAMTI